MATTFFSVCHLELSHLHISCVQADDPQPLETALTVSVSKSVMSGMSFLPFTTSLFLIFPCSIKECTCVYELLLAKIRECEVLAKLFFHYSLIVCWFFFFSLLFFYAAFLCLLFLLFFPSHSFYGNEQGLFLGACQSGLAGFAPTAQLEICFKNK